MPFARHSLPQEPATQPTPHCKWSSIPAGCILTWASEPTHIDAFPTLRPAFLTGMGGTRSCGGNFHAQYSALGPTPEPGRPSDPFAGSRPVEREPARTAGRPG